MDEEINVNDGMKSPNGNANENIQVVNTNNSDAGAPDSRMSLGVTSAADFTAGPFVTRRNPTGEITSMLSSLYISDDEEKSDDEDDDDEESSVLNVNVLQTMQTEVDKLKVDLLALSARVQTNENDCKQAVDSSINRETSFREAVDAGLADLEEFFRKSQEKLERAVFDCFLRRDAKWENQLKKLRISSTPSYLSRLQPYSPTTPISSIHDYRKTTFTSSVNFPTAQTGNATYDVTSVNNPVSNVPTPPVVPSVSSFSGRPPIRLEFPTFGESSETSEVLNFIEQCENYLNIRPLPSVELVGTLSTVLKGPALSWWKAERNKVTDWQSFKEAFMDAFLPDDYLAEVEDKLRSLVQLPRQRLRDFAYDYRALCLKWKPDMAEEEMVSRILNNTNPRVAGCLRGTVKTVEQLVKVGSMVEKDCMGVKDYWQKVDCQNGKEKANKRPSERNNSKSLAGLSIAQPHPISSLLVVPVTIKGKEVKAVLDTGSTYTLMQESLWKQLGGEPSANPLVPLQQFIMADGKIHQAFNKKTICYNWHEKVCGVDTYIMKDAHLAFPLIAGLDFLRATEAVVDVGQGRYGLKVGKGYMYHSFITTTINPGGVTIPVGERKPTSATVSLYYALPSTGHLSLASPDVEVTPRWDSDNQEELLKLIETWPHTTSQLLGKTSVEQHKIILCDELPVRSRAYRVSPLKKK